MNENKLISAAASLLTCLAVVGCASTRYAMLPTLSHAVDERDWKLLDKYGREIPLSKDTFTLAAADTFRYKGTEFKTPHREFEQAESLWNNSLAKETWQNQHAHIAA